MNGAQKDGKMICKKDKKWGKIHLALLLLFASIALASLASSAHASSGAPSFLLAAGIDLKYFALALAIPIAAVSIAYMASYAFNVPHLRAVLQDELLQIIATGAVALTIIGTQGVVDEYVVAALHGAGATGNDITSALDGASDMLSGLSDETIALQNNMLDASVWLGGQASKSIFCNFMGVGFTLPNCGQYNAYRGGLTSAMFTTTAALADTYAQQYILSLARNYAFTIIIPLGLLLRCFKMSRAAGGALIAIGFGFYTVFPVVMLATENLLHSADQLVPPPSIPFSPTCDPYETNMLSARAGFSEYGNSLLSFDLITGISYFVLVRVLFMSILNLIITLGFIRAFAHIIGSDIDVSGLARIS